MTKEELIQAISSYNDEDIKAQLLAVINAQATVVSVKLIADSEESFAVYGVSYFTDEIASNEDLMHACVFYLTHTGRVVLEKSIGRNATSDILVRVEELLTERFKVDVTDVSRKGN